MYIYIYIYICICMNIQTVRIYKVYICRYKRLSIFTRVCMYILLFLGPKPRRLRRCRRGWCADI